ncbi:MAG: DUF4236 domain-containing protein [Deltaproteobacteria bacterium]|nr:DUF4236 domain-containing protein [Deltaproteobacteria bacterium]
MAFRFWRRIKIAPGVTLNLSKSGVSLSFGPRGAKFTVGGRGKRATVGLPGTGLFYPSTFPSGKQTARKERTCRDYAPTIHPEDLSACGHAQAGHLTLGFFKRLITLDDEEAFVDGSRELALGNEDSAHDSADPAGSGLFLRPEAEGLERGKGGGHDESKDQHRESSAPVPPEGAVHQDGASADDGDNKYVHDGYFQGHRCLEFRVRYPEKQEAAGNRPGHGPVNRHGPFQVVRGEPFSQEQHHQGGEHPAGQGNDQKGNNVCPDHQYLDGSHRGNNQKIHGPPCYPSLDAGINQVLNPHFFHEPSSAQGQAKAEKEEESPQHLARVRRQDLSEVFYKEIGQHIDKPNQGRLKGETVGVCRMKRQLTG